MKDHSGERVPSHTDTWQDWSAEEWIFMVWSDHATIVKGMALKKARDELDAFKIYFRKYCRTPRHERGKFKYDRKKDHITALDIWLGEAHKLSGCVDTDVVDNNNNNKK
ncbi:MAG: hypothetical protein ACTSUE_10540 [Promethearchaeota archaeon]